MIGYAIEEKRQVINRVIQPLRGEKVGIVGIRNNTPEYQAPICPDAIRAILPAKCPTVFEYSEIDLNKVVLEESYSNIANHVFRVDYLQKLLLIEK